MGKYIHLFETEGEYNTVYNGGGYVEPWVSYTEDVTRVDYNKEKWPFGLLDTPLTFEITGGGNICWKKSTTATTLNNSIEYRLNNDEWIPIQPIPYTASTPFLSVEIGDVVQFRGNNAYNYSYWNDFLSYSGTTAQFKVKGNIMSLVNSTSFSGMTSLSSDNTFRFLFKNCTGLTDASQLI